MVGLSSITLLLLLLSSSTALGLVTTTTTTPRRQQQHHHLVNIVGLPGGQTQSLPTNYVQNFQRWQVDASSAENDSEVRMDSCQRSNVNFELQWTPTLQIRPAMEFLIKGGIPTYVMAGVQLRDDDNDDNDSSSFKTRPLARQWTTIQFAVEPNFRIELFRQEQTSKTEKDTDTDDTDDTNTHIVDTWNFGDNSVGRLQQAMELFGVVTSQLEEDSPLLDGIHILSIPLQVDWATFPKPITTTYSVSCLATAEPDAQELLTIDPDLMEMTASSILEMTVIGPPLEQQQQQQQQQQKVDDDDDNDNEL